MDFFFVLLSLIWVAGCHGDANSAAKMPNGPCEKAFYPNMDDSPCKDKESPMCKFFKDGFCSTTTFCETLKLDPEVWENSGEFITVRCEKDSCQNGKCTCKTGFSGEFCETADCTGVECQTGLSCYPNEYDSTFSCKCKATKKRRSDDATICRRAHEWGHLDPLIHTLDGSQFIMVGSDAPCMYYLAVAEDFIVELETIDARNCKNIPRCAERVVIDYRGTVVSLGYGGVAKIVRGHQWTPLQLPFENYYFHCYQESAEVQKCVLDNSVTVSFTTSNNYGREDVEIPELYYGKVKGLVGYFDGNSVNDFMMSNGEVSPKQGSRNKAFEDSWKVSGLCGAKKRELTEREEIDALLAQNPCRFVNNSVFDNCKAELKKEHFYDICKMNYDLCSKDSKVDCFCGIIEDLVTNCDITNHPVGEWRKKMEICNKKCPEGEVYNSCGNPCTYSCDNIKMDAKGYCVGSCLPMCACPNGLTRDAHGKCIPQSECP